VVEVRNGKLHCSMLQPFTVRIYARIAVGGDCAYLGLP
jgi:hypothetical protein